MDGGIGGGMRQEFGIKIIDDSYSEGETLLDFYKKIKLQEGDSADISNLAAPNACNQGAKIHLNIFRFVMSMSLVFRQTEKRVSRAASKQKAF